MPDARHHEYQLIDSDHALPTHKPSAIHANGGTDGRGGGDVVSPDTGEAFELLELLRTYP